MSNEFKFFLATRAIMFALQKHFRCLPSNLFHCGTSNPAAKARKYIENE
jgi:hypothetical protein